MRPNGLLASACWATTIPPIDRLRLRSGSKAIRVRMKPSRTRTHAPGRTHARGHAGARTPSRIELIGMPSLLQKCLSPNLMYAQPIRINNLSGFDMGHFVSAGLSLCHFTPSGSLAGALVSLGFEGIHPDALNKSLPCTPLKY
jgi:hypothetical protein